MFRVKRDHYKNGQLRYEVPYHNYKQHGIEKWWHDNGQIQYEISWYKGQRHGIYKWWYDNGQVRLEAIFYCNQRHGIIKEWYSSGMLDYKKYYLYHKEVTEEEYRKHKLIERLARV